MAKKNYHTTKYQLEEEQLLSSFPQQDKTYLKNLLEEASNLKVKNNESVSIAWEKVEKQLPDARVMRFSSIERMAMGVAASILLFIASISLILSGNIEVTTTSGEHHAVYLPDGSEVVLNAKSHLSYNKYLWKLQRSVRLDGEAFFQVQKGERFEVISKENIVSVLGTSFNVLAREDEYKVACFTGKVRVATKEQEVILTPGLSTNLKNGKLSSPSAFEEMIVGSWKRGGFYFDNTALQKVFDTIERQFDVTISSQKLQRKYTGYFDMSNLEQALKVVCEPMGLRYHIKNKTVIIYQNNQ